MEFEETTLFKSQELWDFVNDGFVDSTTKEPTPKIKEKRKKDSKALFLIQQTLDDEIFPRIISATTSKQAWDTLKQEFLGDKKIVMVRLQSLRKDFETATMKEKEKLQEYLSMVSVIVHLMKSYGENMTNEHVVSKGLRSLISKCDHVVAVIEESKDMKEYTFDELMGPLQAHEDRLNKYGEKNEVRAF